MIDHDTISDAVARVSTRLDDVAAVHGNKRGVAETFGINAAHMAVTAMDYVRQNEDRLRTAALETSDDFIDEMSGTFMVGLLVGLTLGREEARGEL